MADTEFISELANRCRNARSLKDLILIAVRIKQKNEQVDANFILTSIKDYLTGSSDRHRLPPKDRQITDQLIAKWRNNGIPEASNSRARN